MELEVLRPPSPKAEDVLSICNEQPYDSDEVVSQRTCNVFNSCCNRKRETERMGKYCLKKMRVSLLFMIKTSQFAWNITNAAVSVQCTY
jgi:hypothetical protein